MQNTINTDEGTYQMPSDSVLTKKVNNRKTQRDELLATAVWLVVKHGPNRAARRAKR